MICMRCYRMLRSLGSPRRAALARARRCHLRYVETTRRAS